MKKLRKIVASKRWALWTAVCWSALAGVWINRFFETRALVQKGIFSEQLAGRYLMAEGGLAILGVIVAVLAWRQWFLYDKKKNDPNDQK
jgi:UDP-N-acetylmuramyl pentapeptide phosphotransferase/UDP-N-acetylglucosamine-1-phosphate transferase